MKTIYSGGEGEIIEKKSRFIATVQSACSEEEAARFIAEMKKKYWDARHNCSAYIVGGKRDVCRCSDDGEPAQTAGRPMLDVLLGEELHDTVVVVTRYFGGTLLGTGGLVRAYQGAVREGLKNCVIIDKKRGRRLTIGTDYNGLGKIQHLLAQQEIPVIDTAYTDRVRILCVAPFEKQEQTQKQITEATNGTAQIIWDKEVAYAYIGKNIEIFEKNA